MVLCNSEEFERYLAEYEGREYVKTEKSIPVAATPVAMPVAKENRFRALERKLRIASIASTILGSAVISGIVALIVAILSM
jgi:hypothetical protein